MPGTEHGSLSSKKCFGTQGFFGGLAEYRLNKSDSFPRVIRADQQCNQYFQQKRGTRSKIVYRPRVETFIPNLGM